MRCLVCNEGLLIDTELRSRGVVQEITSDLTISVSDIAAVKSEHTNARSPSFDETSRLEGDGATVLVQHHEELPSSRLACLKFCVMIWKLLHVEFLSNCTRCLSLGS